MLFVVLYALYSAMTNKVIIRIVLSDKLSSPSPSIVVAGILAADRETTFVMQ